MYIIVSSLQHKTTPEGRAVSPPLSAGLATHSFVIPKGGGLRIVIGMDLISLSRRTSMEWLLPKVGGRWAWPASKKGDGLQPYLAFTQHQYWQVAV